MNTTVVQEHSVAPKWLIKDHQWKEISKHSVLRQEDRHVLDLLAIMSRYVLRSPQSNEKEYKNFRADLKKAVEREESALDTLRRLIANDALFSAIASEWDLLQIVFGIFEDKMVTPQQLRRNLQMELLNKERLLAIYNIIKLRLGGAGRIGNDALSVIVRCLSYLSYIRKGKPLSQTNVDISLVWQLYNIGAHGRHITAATVREKIKDLTRAWDATEVEAQIKKINSLLETPLNDILLALFLAANKTRRVPLKDWENWEKGIQRIVQLLPKSA